MKIDYAGRMAIGDAMPLESFALQGKLYGLLRLSTQGEVLERYVLPALDGVRQDHIRVCLVIRDPRDMIVSQFFHNRDGKPLRREHACAVWKEEDGLDDTTLAWCSSHGVDAHSLPLSGTRSDLWLARIRVCCSLLAEGEESSIPTRMPSGPGTR